ALRQGRECPLCRRLDVARDRTIALLGALLEDLHERRAFASGYGLCVCHAARALATLGPGPARDTLGEVMCSRLALLRWQLEEQLRGTAWQARPEARGPEAGAWLDAIKRFSGTD